MVRPNTVGFILDHPLNRGRPVAAMSRFVGWQVGSRLKREHIHHWVDDTKLAVHRGMHGATGNIYCGLHEYPDMAFALHLLRPGDTFLDVGANVGSYAILASGVCGARTLAFEPDADTTARLRRNVAVNGLERLVDVHEHALGSHEGTVAFTLGCDTTNRVAKDGPRRVPVRRLDDIQGAMSATLIKLDVEGYEAQVLAGASSVLSAPTLLAVETEDCDASIADTFATHGFVRRWYDPAHRSMAPAPVAGFQQANALFVRDEREVAERLRSAPGRRIHGHGFT